MQTTTISVRKIPLELWRQVRAAASLKGISVPDFVAKALASAVNGKKAK